MSPRTPRVGSNRVGALAGIGLLAVTVAAVGVVAGALLIPETPPSSVATPTGDRTVAVSTQQFDDARTVAVEPQVTVTTTLAVTDAGKVTRSSCTPGGLVTAGASPLTVDDRPVVALATNIPLWRDLGPGMRGPDVTALQAELARLGYAVSADGSYGAETKAAAVALFRSLGVERPTGNVPVASVMWLPSAQVVLASCDVQISGQVPGSFGTVAGGLASLRVSQPAPGAAAGERVLRYGGLTAPVDEKGYVTDVAFLAALAASPEWAFASEQGAETLSLEYALAAPLDVAVVPPAALFELSAEQACVVADGVAVRVTVVSSALGQALVTFDSATVPTTVDSAPAPAAVSEGCG